MKKMRLWGVVVSVMLLCGCAPGDRSLMNGKWVLVESRVNGVVEFSSDKKTRQRIADSLYQNDARYISEVDGINEGYLRMKIEERLHQLGKLTLEIRKDRTFTFEREFYGSIQTREGTTITDESEKVLYMNGDETRVYNYEISIKELKLLERGDAQQHQLIFRRI